MACCKVHKETECNVKAIDNTSTSDSSFNDSTTNTTATIATSTLTTTTITNNNNTNDITENFADRLKSNSVIKSFLDSHPYLQIQLPVLLARIARPSVDSGTSELAKDLERRERVGRVLKEAIETDPQVAELFELLQKEKFI